MPTSDVYAKRLQNAIQHWTQVCRTHTRSPFMKLAAKASDSEIPYEQAFSNLAHTYLRNKAPGLQDYELGFQLLEKNEDNDKAIGVFGFKVGQQLMYAPVFFLNGDLKGHDLLYLKESDTFVPLTEGWVNYILGRKPDILGEESTRNHRLLGVERPHLEVLSRSPYKYASSQPPWLQEGLPGLFHAIHPTTAAAHLSTFSPVIPSLVKSSAAVACQLLQMINARPKLAHILRDCYGPDLLSDAFETAKTIKTAYPVRPKGTPHKHPTITGSVFKEVAVQDDSHLLQIYNYDGNRPEGLTAKEAEDLKRTGLLIKDAREDYNHAYTVMHPKELLNPDATGLYNVLTKPGSMEKLLVLHHPHGQRGPHTSVVLIRPEGRRSWINEHPSRVWTTPNCVEQDYEKWFKEHAGDSLEAGSTYVLLGPRGDSTSVFKIINTLPATGGAKCLHVSWKDLAGSRDMPDRLPPIAPRFEPYAGEDSYVPQICIGQIRGHKIINSHGVVQVPKEYKALRLNKAKKDSSRRGSGMAGWDAEKYDPGDSIESEDPPLLAGNNVDLELGILKAAHAVKIVSADGEVNIGARNMPRKAALCSLVRDYRLPEKEARHLLNKADQEGSIKIWFQKVAYGGGYSDQMEGPAIPDTEYTTDSYFGTNLPLQIYQEDKYSVGGMRHGDRTEANPGQPPDDQTMMAIMEAAQTGQREVLDTSLLTNLLKGTKEETVIDQHLGDIVKGLDRIGRLLFNFYWHHEMYEERFGPEKLADLEDMLRNSFVSTGDLVLELKKKAIETYPTGGVDDNMDAAAEV